jgi:hypothetical protein
MQCNGNKAQHLDQVIAPHSNIGSLQFREPLIDRTQIVSWITVLAKKKSLRKSKRDHAQCVQ